MPNTVQFVVPAGHRVNITTSTADGTVHPSRAHLVGRRDGGGVVLDRYTPDLEGANGADIRHNTIPAAAFNYTCTIFGECKDGDWRAQRDVRSQVEPTGGYANFDDHGANGPPNNSYNDLMVQWAIVRARAAENAETDAGSQETLELLEWDGKPAISESVMA
jgi:hypothetical protein